MGRGPERSLVEPSILVGPTLGSNRECGISGQDVPI